MYLNQIINFLSNFYFIQYNSFINISVCRNMPVFIAINVHIVHIAYFLKFSLLLSFFENDKKGLTIMVFRDTELDSPRLDVCVRRIALQLKLGAPAENSGRRPGQECCRKARPSKLDTLSDKFYC